MTERTVSEDSQQESEGFSADQERMLRSLSASTSNSEEPAPRPDNQQRALQRFLVASARGCAAGVLLRGGLHLGTQLLAALRKTSSRKPLPASVAVIDTLKYAAFLSCLGGSFVAVDEGLAGYFGRHRTAEWRAIVAGLVAGTSLLLTGPKQRHTGLAIYILLRGLTLLIRLGNKPQSPQWLRAALAPTRWQHGDVALMCVSFSQILYSFVCFPKSLPQSYVRFLYKAAAKPPYMWDGIRELVARNATGAPPAPLASLKATPLAPFCSRVPCELLHPGMSCNRHIVQVWPAAYARSLAVYAPVYIAPALLVHRWRLLRNAPDIVPKVVHGILRSSFFLSFAIALALRGACAGHQLCQNSTGAIIAASTSIGGLATLCEKKSRRMELALYCLSRALESFVVCLQEQKYIPERLSRYRWDVLMFCIATAAIMHCYSDGYGKHRDIFRSKYLNVLDYVFGNTGITEGCIVHVPSYIQLRKSRQSLSADDQAAQTATN